MGTGSSPLPPPRCFHSRLLVGSVALAAGCKPDLHTAAGGVWGERGAAQPHVPVVMCALLPLLLVHACVQGHGLAGCKEHRAAISATQALALQRSCPHTPSSPPLLRPSRSHGKGRAWHPRCPPAAGRAQVQQPPRGDTADVTLRTAPGGRIAAHTSSPAGRLTLLAFPPALPVLPDVQPHSQRTLEPEAALLSELGCPGPGRSEHRVLRLSPAGTWRWPHTSTDS